MEVDDRAAARALGRKLPARQYDARSSQRYLGMGLAYCRIQHAPAWMEEPVGPSRAEAAASWDRDDSGQRGGDSERALQCHVGHGLNLLPGYGPGA